MNNVLKTVDSKLHVKEWHVPDEMWVIHESLIRKDYAKEKLKFVYLNIFIYFFLIFYLASLWWLTGRNN